MNRWDVYWADAPFEDDPELEKRRPVIIAKDGMVYVLVLRVTSHSARDNTDYALVEWQYAGLDRPSVVRIRKIAQLNPDKIYGYIGKLHALDIVEIQKRMKAYQAARDKRRAEENH